MSNAKAAVIAAALLPILLLLTSTGLAQETVLYDFWSPTCGPCRRMEPTVARLSSAGFPVQKVNVMGSTAERALAGRFNVDRVPCFVMVAGGREVDRVLGSTSYARLEQMVSQAARPNLPPARMQSPDRLPANSPWARHAQRETSATVPNSQPWPPSESGARPATAAPEGYMPPPAAGSVYGGAGGASPENRTPTNPDDKKLIEVSVRLRVPDAAGYSWGTGTIIDARRGEALIVTCGHVFRDMFSNPQQNGTVSVELFEWTPSGPQVVARVPGEVHRFDLDRDIGLVSIRPGREVSVAPIAGAGSVAQPGAAVRSVGCDHGANPTVVATRLTAVNRYLGAPNIEAAGAPIEGRSGGGLFNDRGELVGVCNAADHEGNEGLFAGLESIHRALDEMALSEIYQHGPSTLQVAAAAPTAGARPGLETAAVEQDARAPLADVRPAQSTDAREDTDSPRLAAAGVELRSSSSGAPLRPVEQAAWEEIMGRATEAEVVCIVRPKEPGGRSEVITLSNVSPEFVRRLVETASSTRDANQSATRPLSPVAVEPVRTAASSATAASSPWAAAR